MAMENPRVQWEMHLHFGSIFQPAMLVYQRVQVGSSHAPLQSVRNWSYIHGQHHFLQAMLLSVTFTFFDFTKGQRNYLRYVHQVLKTTIYHNISGVWSLNKSTTLKAAMWIMRHVSSTLGIWPLASMGLKYSPRKQACFQDTCRLIDL